LSAPFRIGVAGLGTVGTGVLRLVEAQAELLAARCGRSLSVVAVSDLDRTRDRGVDLTGVEWYDAVALAREAPVDVVVELIGGEDGIAKAVAEAAIAAGKAVVTANKALLARHGVALARAAEAADVPLAFEAAVAGGIPILKALREGLAGNRIDRIYGILNGTCNFILSSMETTGRDFDEVLAEAQALGYAEADPGFDIDGVDAAHKLALLAALAFGCTVDFEAVHVEGVRHVAAEDIGYAAELGYRVKLLGIARLTEHGLEQRVHPCLVAADTPIARVDGVFNAVVAEGDFVGRTIYEGRGAGAGPTASAVVADIADIACGRRAPAFGVPAEALAPIAAAPMERHRGPYFVRLVVVDRPGVLAEIAGVLRDERVSIESLLQRSRSPDEPVPVIMITHEAEEAAMMRALEAFAGLESVLEPPTMIRIEDL